MPSTSKQQAKLASNEVQWALNAFYFCESILQSPTIEHHIKKSLKPLISLKTIDHKDITNPYLFRGAPMVATFVRSAGNWTKELRCFIEEASRMDIRLAKLEHLTLNVISSKCTSRVPIYVHPCLCRSLKLWYPIDVGGISRDGQVTNELGTSSRSQAVGIFTPEDFYPVVDTE